MAYVIAEPCIGTKDAACVDACPVDCIHPKKEDPKFATEELIYIDPVECIDCGACVPVLMPPRDTLRGGIVFPSAVGGSRVGAASEGAIAHQGSSQAMIADSVFALASEIFRQLWPRVPGCGCELLHPPWTERFFRPRFFR